MHECSSCGCEFDADGFYHTQEGEIIQPCVICRCDNASVYYYNNAEAVRQRRRETYYKDLAASRERERIRKRQYREQAAQMSVL